MRFSPYIYTSPLALCMDIAYRETYRVRSTYGQPLFFCDPAFTTFANIERPAAADDVIERGAVGG